MITGPLLLGLLDYSSLYQLDPLYPGLASSLNNVESSIDLFPPHIKPARPGPGLAAAFSVYNPLQQSAKNISTGNYLFSVSPQKNYIMIDDIVFCSVWMHLQLADYLFKRRGWI